MLVVGAQSQLMVILVGVHAFSILAVIFITTVQLALTVLARNLKQLVSPQVYTWRFS